MPVKIVDASVMAAWAFREPRAAEAFELLRGAELHAPTLLAYEMTSIARTKSAQYPGQADSIREALRLVLALPIRWPQVDHLAVLNLSLATGLSTYDASYLHLAQRFGVPLLTFDRRLEAASGE